LYAERKRHVAIKKKKNGQVSEVELGAKAHLKKRRRKEK
jgi:hypothetical protein